MITKSTQVLVEPLGHYKPARIGVDDLDDRIDQAIEVGGLGPRPHAVARVGQSGSVDIVVSIGCL